MKKRFYRPKKRNDEFEPYINTHTERIAYIKKIHTQHWALEDVPFEFKTNCLNKWDPHPVNITKICTVGRNYTVLADGMKGPMIVEHRNTLAVQFVIHHNYPETVQILQNFVKKKLLEIKDGPEKLRGLDCAKQLQRLAQARYYEKRSPIEFRKSGRRYNKIPTSMFRSFDSNNHNSESMQNHTTMFMHSGWNYSKRHGILVVNNNAAATNTLRVKMRYKNATPNKKSEHSISVTRETRNTTPLMMESSQHAYTTIGEILKAAKDTRNRSVNMNYSTIDSISKVSAKNTTPERLTFSRTTRMKARVATENREGLRNVLVPPLVSSGHGKCVQYASFDSHCGVNSSGNSKLNV